MSPRCCTCDRALAAVDHLEVTDRFERVLPYCLKGCRKPTARDLATSTARIVRGVAQ